METSWFNPYPAWMGWVALGIAFTVIAFVWYRFRQKKNAKSEPTLWRVPVDGFADVFVPKTYFVGELEIELTKNRAEELAFELYEEMQDLWAECERVYEITPEHGWCVDKVSVVNDGMPEDHPHVVWGAPHGRIKLLVQMAMHYWFVRECHNVFRYRMYGMEWIYEDRGGDDVADHAAVEMWINERYL